MLDLNGIEKATYCQFTQLLKLKLSLSTIERERERERERDRERDVVVVLHLLRRIWHVHFFLYVIDP